MIFFVLSGRNLMKTACVLCHGTKRLRSTAYCTISSTQVEMLIKKSYEMLNGTQLLERLVNSRIHKNCYWKYYRNARKSKIISKLARKCSESFWICLQMKRKLDVSVLRCYKE